TADDNDRYVRDGFERFLFSSTRLSRMVTGARASLGLLSAVMVTAFGVLSIHLWVSGAITVGAVAFALSLILRLNMSLTRLMGQLNGLMRHFGVIQNAMETVAQPIEITDAPDAKPLDITDAAIKFENVRFHYGRSRSIIENVSLDI